MKIEKERDFPLRIKQLEALLRRLEPNHNKRPEIEAELRRRLAGLKGEQNLDYFLTFLPEETRVLHHVRLKNEHGYAFQIDTLLITAAFMYTLETKSLSGELYFHKESAQMIRTLNGVREGHSNPLLQAQRQMQQLKNWLNRHKLPEVPIEYGAVISSTSTIIETSPGNEQIFDKVFHAELLPVKAAQLSKKHQNILEEKEMKKIVRAIKKNHEPLEQNILQNYGIDKSEILSGVHCPKCRVSPVKYKWGKWKCDNCGAISIGAHQQALADYALLVGPEMTNQEICSFLQIPSRNIAYKLVKELNLPQTGTGRWTVYDVSSLKYLE